MIEIRNNNELSSILKNSRGGFCAMLDGDFNPISIPTRFIDPVTFFAHRAKVRGLTIAGANISWFGGNIEAPGGANGVGPQGYAVRLHIACKSVSIDGCVIRNADRGVVLDRVDAVAIRNCDFAVRQDGIIANGGRSVYLIGNRFENFYPRPTVCKLEDGIRVGLSRRDCERLGGEWKDGDHSDAIQIRNGMRDVFIVGNQILGISQGIGQMDADGDAPLENVLVLNNTVKVTGFHSITIPRCAGLKVIGNTTQQMSGRRSPLRLDPSAFARDNLVLSP